MQDRRATVCELDSFSFTQLLTSSVMIEIDQEQYERFIGQAYKWLRYDYARDLTQQDWEDLAHDALIKLIGAMARDSYDPRKASLSAYFRTVVRNLAIDNHRRIQARLSAEADLEKAFGIQDVHDDEFGDMFEALSFEELKREHGPTLEDLFQAIELTPAEKTALLLSVGESLRADEIGKILGISAGAVRYRLFSARKKIEKFRKLKGI
ncbi:MAG: RNA polymerase sigma factor [SAR202 cluster bacterium]|nr:RNA polymerase sigma factor [SAR202 cluster bacterium]